jgi:hypothetical protein
MRGLIFVLVRISSAHDIAVLLDRSMLQEAKNTTQPSQGVAALDEKIAKKATPESGFQDLPEETEEKEPPTDDFVRYVEANKKSNVSNVDREDAIASDKKISVARRVEPQWKLPHADGHRDGERLRNGTGGLASGQQSADARTPIAAEAMAWFRAQQAWFSSTQCAYFVVLCIASNCIIGVAMRRLEGPIDARRTVDQSLE